MIQKFVDYLELKRNSNFILDDYKINIIYGDGSKSSKVKPYIYNEFEFYTNESIDNAAYIEQLVIDSFVSNNILNDDLNNSVIFLETLLNYYIITLSNVESRTIKLNKDFSKEQLILILEETLDDNMNKLIYIFKLNNKFDINCLNIKLSTEENLNIENFDIDIKNIEPKLISSKSLKLKTKITTNKTGIFIIFLGFSFLLFSEFYLKEKIQQNLLSNIKNTKEIYYKNVKENKNVTSELEKYKKLNKENIISVIDLNNVSDFKNNYKTEIKKLF